MGYLNDDVKYRQLGVYVRSSGEVRMHDVKLEAVRMNHIT